VHNRGSSLVGAALEGPLLCNLPQRASICRDHERSIQTIVFACKHALNVRATLFYRLRVFFVLPFLHGSFA